MKIFVNAYLEERRYGGPEEGGWYYNHYIPVQSRFVESDDLAELIREATYLQNEMKWIFREEADKDLNLVVNIENKKYESETLYAPDFQ